MCSSDLVTLPMLCACVARVGPDSRVPEPAGIANWAAGYPEAIAAHDAQIGKLADWWARFNDPALDALLAAAQKESSTLAQAAAAIARSRAELITASVADRPSLDAIASANRAAFTLGGPAALRTQSSYGLQ
mgnify:CR=1 FL=1